MEKVTFKGLINVLKKSGSGFMNDKVPKLSASLAYYTIFSLGPMLIVIIFLATIFLGKEATEGTIYGQTRDLVGDNAALQIQEMIKNAAISGGSTVAGIIGFVTLILGATTVFSEIQDSINTIWRLRAKTDVGFKKLLLNRLWSFSLVIGIGFLLLVSLFINTIVEAMMNKLQEIFPGGSVYLLYVVNLVVTLLVISLLFAIIFKLLPDALIRWKDVAVGAIFTAILFMIGKFGITLYINKTDVGSTYGAAGSLAILLVWVYYSSMILYFGAEFTKAYVLRFGSEIRPNEYAVVVKTVQVENKNKSVQQNEKEEEEEKKANEEIE